MHRHNILFITDRIEGPLTNGSQVMAAAVMAELAKWFNIRTIVEEDKDRLPTFFPDQVSLVYNFGCTMFSSALTATIHSLQPDLPVINHFQLVLPEYARNEGYDATESDAFGQDSVMIAEAAAYNIFPSFSEMNRVMRLGWPILAAHNCVIKNAFVPVGEGGAVDPAGEGGAIDPAGGVAVDPAGERVAGRPAAGDVAVHPGTASMRSMRFMAAGRFSDYVKGADLLYRAYCDYYSRDPDVHLYIAGNDQRFIRLLRDIPSHAWTFLGWLERSALHAWLREADVLVVPSRYEPFGMIAIEALALGTPVIAMAIGGLAETIHHGHTGWLSDPQEGSAGLRQAMEEARDQKERWPEMGINAMGAAAAEFSLDNMVREIRKVIDTTLYKHERISC